MTHRLQLKYRNLVESYQVASGVGGRGIVPPVTNRRPTTPGHDGRGMVPPGAIRPPIGSSGVEADPVRPPPPDRRS